MPSTTRRSREREATRGRILDAARELFVARGVDATTMRAIAERLECTAPAIYHHFTDKQSLLRELVTEDIGVLGAAFLRLGEIADPVDRLVRLGLAYVRFGLDHPEHYRLLFMTPGAKRDLPGDMAPAAHESPERDAYGILHATVSEIIRGGRFHGDFGDADRVSQMYWAAVHGLVSLHLVFAEDRWIAWRDVGTSAERMLGALVTGMMASGERRTANND